jgi:hypothetical protein
MERGRSIPQGIFLLGREIATPYAAGTGFSKWRYCRRRNEFGGVPVRILTGGRGLLVLAASVLALAGAAQLVLGWLPAKGSAAAPPQAATVAADGVAAQVRVTRWIAHDHNDETGTGPGYQMPLAMMPGMPADGDVRLAVSVTVTNTGTAGRAVDPAAEFTLRNASTKESWRPRADTFDGLARLGSLSAADGVLFFDLPQAKADSGQLYVSWKHAGESARLAVQPGQNTGTHSHQ